MTNPLLVLQARAEARALLWQIGYWNFHHAVDELQRFAEQSGAIADIGQDEVQRIIAAAFAAVIDNQPLEQEIIWEDPPTTGVANSTLDAAAWLWFQCQGADKEARFRSFMRRHSSVDRAAILQRIKNIRAKRRG